MKKVLLSIIIGILLIIPLIYSFTFFNGFAGQIKPTDYPPDWYEVNNFLNNDSEDFKVLFFPWHGYMNFRWVNNTDKRIANPSRNFFDKEVISGTTVEIGDIYRQDNSPEQIYMDNLLKDRKNITNFGHLIQILNVKYILLAKEVDYKQYLPFLKKQNDLELIKETNDLYVFKNKIDVKKIYQTDDITNINSSKIEIKYEKINPVRYKLKSDIKKRYIVFTEPYSKDWEFDGIKSKMAYNVINVFDNNIFDNNTILNNNGKEKEIIFERFYKINLPAYIISILTFLVLIGIYFDVHKLYFFHRLSKR